MSPRGAGDPWFSVPDRRNLSPGVTWLLAVLRLLLTPPWFLGEHPQLWLPVFPVIPPSLSSQRQFLPSLDRDPPNQLLDQKNTFIP